LQDEGHYWETKDEALLVETFKAYTQMIDDFEFALETVNHININFLL